MSRRHRSTNFYARALAEEQQQVLDSAGVLKGLDDDIALARASTLAVAGQIRPAPRLVFKGLETIARLHHIRLRTAPQAQGLDSATIVGILKSFGFDAPVLTGEGEGGPDPPSRV
jgi:hypothetical protein